MSSVTAGRGEPWKAAGAAGAVARPRPAAVPLRFRPLWVLVSAALFFGFCAGLVWLVTWWARPQPIQAVFLAAGYEANLAVPHNSYGRRWSEAAAARVGGMAAELRRDAKWDAALKRTRAKTVVLSISAHGGADAAGPYLLPTDAAPGPAAENRLRLGAILDRLAALPADVKKVLALEAGQMPANPLFGPPDAEFATALEALDLAAVPNLSVLAASGPGERAWPAEVHGATAFGHFVALGLAGAADADGDRRVTLLELFEYVAPRVEEFAARNRAAVQRPRLYPAGDEGVRRARAVVVAQVPSAPAEVESPLPPLSPPPALRSAWERYAARAKQQPPPASYAPHLWRVYGATLVRAEELALARDDAGATTVLGKAAEVEAALDAARGVDVADPQLAAAVFGPPPADDARAAVNGLWAVAPADAAKAAAAVTPSPAVFDLLLDRAVEDPARNLNRAAEVVRLLDRPGRPRPAAAHLLVALATHAPAGRPELVRTALTVHRLGEAAAAAGGQGYGDRIAPWLAERLKAADAARAAGEDRLFATDPGDAAERLAAAKAGYDAVLADAARLRRAFEVRDRLFAELPFLADWASRFPAGDAKADAAADDVAKLWATAHDLDKALAPPANAADLARTADDAAKLLDALTTTALRPTKDLLPAPPPGLAPRAGRDAIERAMALPAADADTRAKLWPLADRFVRDATASEPPAEFAAPAVQRRAALAAAALGRGEKVPPFDRVPQLPGDVRRLLETDPVGDPAAVRTAFRQAERLARVTPAAVPLRTEPAVALRGLLAQDLALALADRHVDHLWAGDSPTEEPYYKLAAGRLLADVAALGPLDAVRDRLGAVRGRLDLPFRPAVATAAAATATDPTPFAVDVGLGGGRADALPGFVTVWAEPQVGLTLVGPATRQALPWPGTTRYRVEVAGGAAANVETGVRVRGYFRGWAFAGTAAVTLSPVPDVVAASVAPPPGAAVTLRASADAVRKYGAGDGAVAVVVDCSGSMAAPDGTPPEQSRYAQGVAAAGKIIAALPRETVVTVFAFGQAGEGRKRVEAVERTIAKIAGPFRRDPDDATQVTQVVDKLAKLEPFNESPIYRATLTARDEVLTAGGYRAVVLVSDGLDNRVTGEAGLNPKAEPLPALLRAKFREGGVLVHAVGFPTRGREDAAAAEQLRDFVEGLPTPGKYVIAPDVDDLIAALRAGLSSRLTARLTPAAAGKPIELDVTPGGTADRWAKAAAGPYRLTTTAAAGGADVRLADGDRLLLGLDVGPSFRRLTLADDFPARPFARGDRGDWRATLLQSQKRDKDVALLVGLESTETAAQIARPAEVWFDVATDFPDLAPASVRWRPVYDYPGPTWELLATNWPAYPGGGAAARPVVRVWFEPTASAAPTAGVALKTVLDAGAPVAVAVGGKDVEVERVDPTAVTGAVQPPGTVAVRVRHDPDRPLLLRLDGVTPVSAERRVHGKAGVTVGLFRLPDAADPRAARLTLVPLTAFKAAARRIELRDLPPPDPDDRPGR